MQEPRIHDVDSSAVDAEELHLLERRLGREHAKRRLSAESDHEVRMVEQYLSLPRLEATLTPIVIEWVLKATGMYRRGRRNAESVEVRHHNVQSPQLPPAFDGFVILHLSDLHGDISQGAMERVRMLVDTLRYDICVLTGDYRGATFGPCDAALAVIAELRPRLRSAVYGVLGDHDPARMLPAMENMQIRILMNESAAIERGGQHIHLAGIDDANFFRTHDIGKAAAAIPRQSFSILLSHTPAVYREAANAGFDLLLSGHTHGGQICLPGGVAVVLKSNVPRRFGAGAWQHEAMQGYTSVGSGSSALPARFNCRPEITLHYLRGAPRAGSENGAS